MRQHCDARKPVSIGLLGNAAEVLPELVRRAQAGGLRPDLVTDQTSAHDLINGYLPAGWTVAAVEGRPGGPGPHARWPPRPAAPAPARAGHAGLPGHGHARWWTTATTSARWPRSTGWPNAFDFPGFVPAYIRPLFCEGKGPFRWVALSGDPEDIYRTDAKIKELFPENRHVHRWLDMARERISFQGLPARICWLGLGERHRAGLAFNEMVRTGELKAPIVIGRDHLDSGSVASPNRETEAMRDGTDAVSDWPLLNALLSTAGGATWVSLHHGGGVGMGFSQHAGLVIVADGTEAAARRLERVLWNDPATGVMRHADAGYELAQACAREHGPEPAHAGLSGRFATLTSTLMEAASAAEKVRGLRAQAGSTTLYQLVKDHIRLRIHEGTWKAGDRIPSEHELVAELGVSRMTVHRALREMAEHGILARLAGIGTFVAEERPQSGLLKITNIATETRARGHEYACDVLLVGRESATPGGGLGAGPAHRRLGLPRGLRAPGERRADPAGGPLREPQGCARVHRPGLRPDRLFRVPGEDGAAGRGGARGGRGPAQRRGGGAAGDPAHPALPRAHPAHLVRPLVVTFVRCIHPGSRYRLGSRFRVSGPQWFG